MKRKSARSNLRILFVSDTYPPDINGAAYFTQRLAQRLKQRGHEVHVLKPSQSLHNTFETDSSGVSIYSLRSLPIFFYSIRISPSILRIHSVHKIIRTINPDIIHIQNHFFLGRSALKSARRLRVPIIGTNHFVPETLTVHIPLPDSTLSALKSLLWFQFNSVYSQLDAVTAPTYSAASLSKLRNLNKPVITISNGIDLKRFKPNQNSNYLKARYGIPEGNIILYVGRLEQEKRLEVLLRAMPQILKKTDVHLILTGTGTMKPQLMRMIASLGISNEVTFTGYVADRDLPKIYALATVFVMTGNMELQSIATMEAMASGLPIIAAESYALPELVHSGENGFLFPEGDSEKLASKVITLLGSKYLQESMAKRSLEIIQSHDIDKVTTMFELLYKNIISRYDKQTRSDFSVLSIANDDFGESSQKNIGSSSFGS